MSYTKKYPAKLLLFGEYTIIQDSKALAIPLHLFSGQWQKSAGDLEKQLGLPVLLDYIQAAEQKGDLSAIDTSAFAKALSNGDYFNSDIPHGYGLGSSGALVAAVYDRFATRQAAIYDEADLLQLKKILAQIESCFHGASSGADPLVCYLNQAVLFHSKTKMETVTVNEAQQSGLFLLDTGKHRQTEPLVKAFLQKCEDPVYNNRLIAELIPLVEDAIAAFLRNDSPGLMDLVHQISYFQFKYFGPMITDEFRTSWLDSLNSAHTKLKLCGAGGGGCILGFTSDPDRTRDLLKKHRLIFVNEPKSPTFR